MKTYTIDELEGKALEKAIDEIGQSQAEWWDGAYIIDYWKEELALYGFFDPAIHYSGFGCQSDYCNIIGTFDPKKFVEKCPDLFGDNLVPYYACLGHFIEANVYVLGRRSSTVAANILSRDDEEVPHPFNGMSADDFTDMIDSDEIEDAFEEKLKDLAREILVELEKDYSYCFDIEACKEFARDNEWRFDEEGRMV